MATYPRDLAVRILTGVLSDHRALDAVLEELSPHADPHYRGWLQEVCSGTLRWKGRLDLAIDSTATKKKPSGWLRKCLLVASYQLIGQERTSPGAVVSETVDQVRKREGQAPSKFVNASLRKISEHALAWREHEINSPQTASLPEWWWDRLVAENGKPWTKAFAKASLERPKLWIRSKDPEWKPSFEGASGPVAGSFHVEAGGAITELSGFAEGKFIVQDISSQTLISEVSKLVKEAFPEPTALDLCSAPGGKAIGLAWNGFQVTATDIDAARLKLVKQNIGRVSPVKVVATPQLDAGTQFDLVWVDAPCTGSGIIRRHPDSRWLKRESDVTGLARTQAELLQQAWERVRSGGFLAYSVCSVFQEEGPKHLTELPAATLVQQWALSPHLEPFGDGFWAVLLRKK